MNTPSSDQNQGGDQDQTQTGEGQTQRKKPGPKPKVLESVVNSDPEQRLDQLRIERRDERCANMFDPLGERSTPAIPLPPNSFDDGVANMVYRDPRSALYRDMLLAVDPDCTPTGHDPVVYLAMSGVPLETFVGLLPWARSSLDNKGFGRNTAEAVLWGVGNPRQPEVWGFLQAFAYPLNGGNGGGSLANDAALALIKQEGALHLEAALFRAVQRLHAWSPQSIWKQANVGEVSAREAADVYIEAAKWLVPFKYHDSVRNLAAIAWNKDKIAPRNETVSASILTPSELVASTLRAAVLNYTDAETLRGLQKEMLCCVSPRANAKQVEKSLAAILSKLGLESAAPHRRFIEYVVKNARSGLSGPQLLQAAWGQVSNEFPKTVVSDLLRIETSLLGTTRLSEPPFRGAGRFLARDVVAEALRQFKQVCRGNLLWTVMTHDGTFSFNTQDGQPPRVIDEQAIAAVVPVSAILAGTPLVERTRLVLATR